MATALRLAETDAIKKALRSTQGKKMKAAELLGISRKVLWQRMKVLGIGEES
jgi:transcriptional regulator of acetoin/glycerol metabolism